MEILIAFLIIWAICGVITLMVKLVRNEHMFDGDSMYSKKKASWGQIAFLSFVYGPIWLIIIPIMIICFIIGYGLKRIKMLWILLSEIGPR